MKLGSSIVADPRGDVRMDVLPHVCDQAAELYGDSYTFSGFRVPTIIVGPTVKRGFIDPTSYDTTSILKLITRRFGLEPLPGVRQNMGDLTNALEF